MRKRLLDFIICPICKKNFDLKIFKEEGEEIKEGLLLCHCGQFFPIIENIPRILVGDLRSIIYENFPEFFLKYQEFLPQEESSKKIKGIDLKKKKTSESFGYEWQKFSEMLKDWEKNFRFYFEPVGNINLLKKKLILDAGCGKGRHTYYAAKFAKEIIAFDLSQAVDVAFYNNRNSNNIHFIQADIYNLPFKEESFDFIFSLGVLHHLPTPEEGFKKLLTLLKPKGDILIYVYHSFPKNTFNFYALKFVNFFRNLTTRMPHDLLYLLCYPIAYLSYLFFILPYKIFRALNIKKISQTAWPLKLYADYPFRVILNDTFDRFSAPIENRYSKEEILSWFKKANLSDIKLLDNGGWRIFGKKV